MIKTKEELQEQAKKIGLTFWEVHKCSLCGYPCGFIITEDEVGYDSGCDCIAGGGIIQPRSWENLAECYNLNQPENNPKISPEYLKELNDIWKF
jgi:hypothetical protein